MDVKMRRTGGLYIPGCYFMSSGLIEPHLLPELFTAILKLLRV